MLPGPTVSSAGAARHGVDEVPHLGTTASVIDDLVVEPQPPGEIALVRLAKKRLDQIGLILDLGRRLGEPVADEVGRLPAKRVSDLVEADLGIDRCSTR